MRSVLCCLMLAISLLSGACSKKPAEAEPGTVVVRNDFESLEGWVPAASAASLSQDQAHSGTTALRVGPGQDYSLGYANMLGKMSKTRPRIIRIKAWGYRPNEAAVPTLVAELVEPGSGKHILWAGLDFAPQASKPQLGQWVQGTKDITVPAEATYTTQLFVYGWNNKGTEPSYIDDVEISFIK